jgi:hypothetical protein
MPGDPDGWTGGGADGVVMTLLMRRTTMMMIMMMMPVADLLVVLEEGAEVLHLDRPAQDRLHVLLHRVHAPVPAR